MNVFEAVKGNVTTRQAAEMYGIRVNRHGMAVCPFHNDKNPSMKVDMRFHCFACQADGDAVDFVSRLFGLPSKEAAMKLADDFGICYQEDIEMIEDTKVWLQSPERKAPQKERDYAVARMDGIIKKIRKAMQSTLEKVKSTLLRPDKKKAVTEEIKKQAKPSILESLRRGMEEQRKRDSESQTQKKQKKQDMEL